MNPFPVFLASNNKYAPLLATAIMSIAETASGAIAFHVFNDSLSPSTMSSLHKLAARYNMPLTFHSVDLAAFRDCPSGWFKTSVIYARYTIAELFPEYDQALYVDADMIFTEDILQIPRISPKSAALAACADMGIASFVNETAHKTALGIHEEHTYFNNGLLLINCRQWRQESIASSLLKIAHERAGLLKCPSQDPMNIYFSPNRYFLLPQKFNYMPVFSANRPLPVSPPAVIHFTERKPWGYPRDPYADVYWKLALRGPFISENIKRYFAVKASQALAKLRQFRSPAASQQPLKDRIESNEV
jgi:lipopolysaccharide biosynthesis glycosyltransferase